MKFYNQKIHILYLHILASFTCLLEHVCMQGIQKFKGGRHMASFLRILILGSWDVLLEGEDSFSARGVHKTCGSGRIYGSYLKDISNDARCGHTRLFHRSDISCN